MNGLRSSTERWRPSTTQVISHCGYFLRRPSRSGVVRSTSPSAPSLTRRIFTALQKLPVFGPIQEMHPREQRREDQPVRAVQEALLLHVKFEKTLERLLLQLEKHLFLGQDAALLEFRHRFARRIAVVPLDELADRRERV